MKTHLICNLCYGAGIICLLYFLFIAGATRMNSFFHIIWLVFSIFFIMMGKVFTLSSAGVIQIPRLVTVGGCILAGLLLILLLVVEGIIVKNAASEPEAGAKYVIVLGAQVKGKAPSLALLSRLKAAHSYLKENPEAKVIVSGAKGYGEEITEAQCMYNWLVSQKIKPERILKEERSVNTDENIQFSRNYIENPDDYVVIVTNSFHTYRAQAIARKQGLTNVQGMGSESTFYMIPTYYLREAMAVVKYKLTGQI